jgi:hypothetical protein
MSEPKGRVYLVGAREVMDTTLSNSAVTSSLRYITSFFGSSSAAESENSDLLQSFSTSQGIGYHDQNCLEVGSAAELGLQPFQPSGLRWLEHETNGFEALGE